MKFAVSFSGGKDGALAMHRLVQKGWHPVCLVTMVNKAENRSWFHGADPAMLAAFSSALGLPLISRSVDGEHYHLAFEDALCEAKSLGAEAVCFGDIDMERNRAWSEARCRATGLKPVFPLWQCGREDIVREAVAAGFRCLIKTVNASKLQASLAGRFLDQQTLGEIQAAGVDICGENGEYHTIAIDGPIFKKPLNVATGKTREENGYAFIETSLS